MPEFLAVEAEQPEVRQAGRDGEAGGGQGGGQPLGGDEKEARRQAERDALELAVHGLDGGAQGVLLLGPAEGLVGRAAVAEQGVADPMHEQGEADDVLVGPAAKAGKDVGQGAVVGDEIEQSENGVGQRQSTTDLTIKRSHGGSPPVDQASYPKNYSCAGICDS